MNICVFCASSDLLAPVFYEQARLLGEEIARHSCEVVYGGTNCGLMKEVAQAALRAGGKVKGIIPACIQEKGIAATGLTELVITSDMKERKQKMRETADAFLAMPGGWGTLEEITEVITLKQLGIHNKPVIFLNIEGFYDSFFSFIQESTRGGFIAPVYEKLYKIAGSVPEVFHYLKEEKDLCIDSKY
ncbi:TIGR00730 family Rossman fold protein [Odoribacter laneus]|uniref:LOG family protein n=1 Tax=Odoribacter laneus TaxID=626933 RepID=UPI003AF726CA